MHILMYYCLLAVSCIFLMISTPFTEARTHGNGLTLDLIHRYSPSSPSYNATMTRKELVKRLALNSAMRHQHFKLVSDRNFDITTIPNQGDYLMRMSIGLPPTQVFVISDTGSNLMWVQCRKPCDRCYYDISTTFDPRQSTTYKPVFCNSLFCITQNNQNCPNSTSECEYWYSYGHGGVSTHGVMAVDLFTFVSTSYSRNNDFSSLFLFGCGFDQTGPFDNNAAGIVGLGSGPLSLISQMGGTINNQFSYCLTPSTSNVDSKLRLGSHVVSKQGSVTTPLVNNPRFANIYAINLKSINVGDQSIMVDEDIAIDTGSTLTYLDRTIFRNLETVLTDTIGVEPMQNPPLEGITTCYEKGSTRFMRTPNMVFHLDGGCLSLNANNLLIDTGEYVCLAIVATEENGDPMILGNVAQVNFEVGIDLNKNTVSFTPMNCSNMDEILVTP